MYINASRYTVVCRVAQEAWSMRKWECIEQQFYAFMDL